MFDYFSMMLIPPFLRKSPVFISRRDITCCNITSIDSSWRAKVQLTVWVGVAQLLYDERLCKCFCMFSEACERDLSVKLDLKNLHCGSMEHSPCIQGFYLPYLIFSVTNMSINTFNLICMYKLMFSIVVQIFFDTKCLPSISSIYEKKGIKHGRICRWNNLRSQF